MPNPNHADREHALFSPSGADRWCNCPGSVPLSEIIPEEYKFVGNAAVQGTQAHEVLEMYLRNKPIDGFPAEYQNAASTCLCWIKLKFPKWKDYQVLLERRVYAGRFFGIPDEFLHGTADITMLDIENLELVVLDFKYGTKRVNAKRNFQLLIYVIGAYLKYFYDNQSCTEVQKMGDIKKLKITMGILQPRVNKGMNAIELNLKGQSDFDFLKVFIRTIKQSYAAAMKFRGIMDAWHFDEMRDENATIEGANKIGSAIKGWKWQDYFTYGSHCYFCQCKAICPAFQQNTVSAFEDMDSGGVIQTDVDSWFQDVTQRNPYSLDVIREDEEFDLFS